MPEKHYCPYCRSPDWLIGQHLLMEELYVPELTQQKRDRPIVLSVVFFCARCSYTMKFNASVIGLSEVCT